MFGRVGPFCNGFGREITMLLGTPFLKFGNGFGRVLAQNHCNKKWKYQEKFEGKLKISKFITVELLMKKQIQKISVTYTYYVQFK